VQLPHTGGGDISGWMEELGPGVTAYEPGAAVLIDPAVPNGTLGENSPGGLAEYVLVPADNLIALQDTDRLIDMAALPIAYGTAHRMLLTRAVLRADETLVVVGASGGVGVACVQLGKLTGARVIACTSSETKAERLRELGADDCVVAPDGEYSAQVWRLTGRKGAEVVVDYSGVDTWPQSVRCVRRHGRLVTCGATSGYDAVTDLRYVWVREIDIRGSDGWARGDLLRLQDLVRSGELRPVIHAVHPLSGVRDVVDMIDEFVKPNWSPYWIPEATRQVPTIRRVIEAFHAAELPVIFLAYEVGVQGRNFPITETLVPIGEDVANCASSILQEVAIFEDLAPEERDLVVLKHCYSGFHGTELDLVLRGLDISTLVISGTMTNYCCGATAREAFWHGYKVLFGSDINSTDDPRLHDAELQTLRRGFARIMSSDDIVDALSR
jgi:alcohol dehydrogenase